MVPIRFGAVAAVQNIPKETARKYVDPTNRVYYQNQFKRAFIVTGAEDIALVDKLEFALQMANKENNQETIQAVDNALSRFLTIKSYNVQSSWDYKSGDPLENLSNNQTL